MLLRFRILVRSNSTILLKGVRHEVFDLCIFPDSNPSGPLINRLKYFSNLFLISPDGCDVLHNFVIEYLSEIKPEFENTLLCLSGAQMGSNQEKNGGLKSRDTLPLCLISTRLG